MHRRSLGFCVIAVCALSGAPRAASAQTLAPGDILLHASRASLVTGAWRVLADPAAASGSRIGTDNAGAAKIAPALSSPADYLELTFAAEAGRPYRIWVRGRAESDNWANDSLHVQFSDSVTSTGAPTMRIGTSSSAEVSIEDGVNAGLAGWGWQDNGYGTMGPLIYFATTGLKTMRIQKREDGLWIDQIMLSPEQFLSAAPGAPKNDDTRFPHDDGTGGGPPPPPPPSDSTDVVLYASTAEITGADWIVVPDGTAAGGATIVSPDSGAAKIETAFANPPSYFELTFYAQANVPHHLWIRGKAKNNYWGNDSVHVQFSDSTTETGSPVYRIGTTSAAWVNLEDCSGCGISGWGWQDNGYGGMGPSIYFASTGTHTLRVQSREDGFSIDQIVISHSQYLYVSPGALKNDATILPESEDTPSNQAPTVALTSPASGSTFTAPATIALTASASDPENLLVDVRFYAGTTLIGTDTTAPYSFTWSSVPAGSYSITAVARDGSGATATSAAAAITVTAAAPLPWRVAFTASTDHDSNVTSYLLEVFASGADPNTATPVASSDLGKPALDANREVVVDRTSFFEALATGNYVITVRAIGSGGSTRSTPYSFAR